METLLKDSLLPNEIMNIIFRYVKYVKIIRRCRLVCKAWNSVATTLCKSKIRVKLNLIECEKLKEDITNFPRLGTIISQIFIYELSDRLVQDREASVKTFRSITDLCPNLINLEFISLGELHGYLKSLNCKEAKMGRIQKIQVLKLKDQSPSVRRFHLWVNFRYRATITCLEICDLGKNDALVKFGGLNTFIGNFHNLKYLQLQTEAECYTIDIAAFIESCTDKLEILAISSGYCGRCILTINDDSIHWLKTTPNNTLKKLDLLGGVTISDYAFKYIITKFNKVCNLFMDGTIIGRSLYDFFGAEALLDQFNIYCEGINHLCVYLVYHINENNKKYIKKKVQLLMILIILTIIIEAFTLASVSLLKLILAYGPKALTFT